MWLNIAPHAEAAWLSRFVEKVQVLGPTGRPGLPMDRLPDGRTMLVYRVLAGASRGSLSAVGPRTRALFKRANDLAGAIVIQFKPGWSALLLGVPAHTLTDRYVPLEAIWGDAGNELLDNLVGAGGEQGAVQRIARALARRSTGTFQPVSGRLARRAVKLIESGEPRVERVAESLGITSRHLRRVFEESIGVAPKEFARSVRLRRAVKEASASQDWGRIANATGYYDQAHLIGDFQDLIGLTPGAFAARTLVPSAG
jgi:AraC-like DNA-binding protein